MFKNSKEQYLPLFKLFLKLGSVFKTYTALRIYLLRDCLLNDTVVVLGTGDR